MPFYEKLEAESKEPEERSVREMETDIHLAIKKIRKAINGIRINIRELKGFDKVDNSSTEYFVLSFNKDVEAIKNHIEDIFCFRDKLQDLYEKMDKNEKTDQSDRYRPEQVKNNQSEEINFREVKERFKKTEESILQTIKYLRDGIDQLYPENNYAAYIKDMIDKIEPLEKSVEELNKCEEAIVEFWRRD